MTGKEISGIFAAFDPQLKVLSNERLFSGLSNDNFLVRTAQQAFLLKCYREHWPAQGLAAQTVFAQQQVCPKPLWTDEVNKLAIFEYLEGDIAQGDYTLELLQKLIAFHCHDVVTEAMDIKYELDFYKQTRLYQQYQASVEDALKQIALLPRDEGFCHNDLVKENIIVNSQGMFLIDFEYAKSNDVYFDLAALTVSFALNDKQKNSLLSNYQQQLPAIQKFHYSLQKLECYQLVFLVLCICWYSARSVDNKMTELRTQLDCLISSMEHR